MISILTLAFAVIFLGAMISSMESAFFSLSLTQARMRAEHDWKARLFLRMKENSLGPITTLTSLSSMTNIGGSILVGTRVVEVFGLQWLGLFSTLLVFLIIIFSQIIPKNIGNRYAESIALWTSLPVFALSLVFTPFTWLISKIAPAFVKFSHVPPTSEAEIAFLAKLGGSSGAIEQDKSLIIQKIFLMNDVTVKDLMTPLGDLAVVEGEKTLQEAKEEILYAKHSYLPVTNGEKREIVGMVSRRDLLAAFARNEEKSFVKSYMTPPFFVSSLKKGDDLLRLFQKQGARAILVTDNRERSIGMVEVEDVLEQLVGRM